MTDLSQDDLDRRNTEAKHGRIEVICGCMFCHRKGQGILMADGRIKPIETIQIGEHVQGPEGPVRVTATHQGTGDMAEIRPRRNRKPFVVTLDHELTLVDTPSRPQGKPCERGGRVVDVSVREWLTWSKRRQGIFKLFQAPVLGFQGEGLPPVGIDPYFLGVLLGDGSLKGRVAVTTVDSEIRQEVCRQAENHNLRVSEDKGSGRVPTLHLVGERGHQNPLTEHLRQIGLDGLTCSDKFIPHEYKTANWEHRKELLAGLIDTDGSLSSSKAGFDFISKSKSLASDVVFLARSLGLHASMREIWKTCQNGTGGLYHRVYIGGDVDLIPVRVARKRPSREVKHRPTLTSFSVEVLPNPEPYFGLTVEGGRYLMDNFLVTHNSGKTEELIRRLRRVQYAHLPFQLFKPAKDDRYAENEVVTHLKDSLPCTAVPDATSIFDNLEPGVQVVGIDEVQFFGPEIVGVCNELANKPFGPMPALLASAEYVTKLAAVCMVCGKAAHFSQVLTEKEGTVLVGGAEAYEARCREHFTPA